MVSMEAAQQASASSFVVVSRLACITTKRDALLVWLKTHVIENRERYHHKQEREEGEAGSTEPKYETDSQAVEASE